MYLRTNSIIMASKNKQFHFLFFCLGMIAIAVLVQTAGTIRGNRIVFPDLAEIGNAFFRLLGNGKTYAAAGTTLLHLLQALAVSLAAGMLIGVAEGLSDRIRSGLIPFMAMVRSLPMIILVILIMTVISFDLVPVVSGAAVLIPLISEAVSEGCRSIEPELTDVYRLHCNFGPRVLWYVYIPLISGYLKQAFFNAAGMGLKVVVSAEYLVQTNHSLGKAVYSSAYFLEYAEIYAYAVIMILLVLVVTELPVYILNKTGQHRALRTLLDTGRVHEKYRK